MQAFLRVFAGLVVWCAMASYSLAQSYIEGLEGKSAEELFELSIQTISSEERTLIRKHLSEAFPDTREGQFGGAHVLNQAGQYDRAHKIFLECVEATRFVPCISVTLFRERENIDFIRRMSDEVDYTYSTYWTVPIAERIARYMARYGNGIEEAEEYLDRVANRSPDGDWIRAHALGYTYWYVLGDASKAEAHLVDAIEKGSSDFETYSLITNIRKDRQNSRAIQEDPELFGRVFEYILDYAAKFPASAKPYQYVAEFEESVGVSSIDGLQTYWIAYAKQPTPELAAKILQKECANLDPESTRVKNSIAEKKRRFSDSPSMLYGMYACYKPTDRKTALEILAQAASNAVFHNDRREWSLRYYNELAFATLEYEKAREIILPFQDVSSYMKNRVILATSFAGRHSEAKRLWLDHNQGVDTVPKRMIETSYRISAFENRIADLEYSHTLSAHFDTWAAISGRQLYWTPQFLGESKGLAPKSEDQAVAIQALLERSEDLGLQIIMATGSSASDRADDLKQRFGARARIDQILLTENAGSSFSDHLRNNGVLIKLIHSHGQPVIESDQITGPVNSFEISDINNMMIFGYSPMSAYDLASRQKLFDLEENGINRISSDGRYLFSWHSWDYSNDFARAIVIYDLATGLVKRRFELDTYWRYSSYNVEWSPTENVIAWVSRSGDVTAYDVEADEIKFVATPAWQRRTGPIAWSPDGETIYFGQGGTRKTFALDANTGEVIKTFEEADWPHSLEATPDGRWLIATDNRRKMHFWNLETGEWHSISLPLGGFQTALSPTGKYIAVSDRYQSGDKENEQDQTQVAIVSVEEQRLIATASRQTRLVTFGRSDDHLFEHNYDVVRRVETETLDLVSTLIEPNPYFEGAVADPDCQCLLTVASDGVSVWSLESGRRIHKYNLAVDALVRDSSRPSVFYARSSQGVFKIDNARFLSEQLFTAEELGFLPQQITTEGHFLGIAGAFSESSLDAKFVIYDTSDWSETLSREFEIVTNARNFNYLIRARVTHFEIDDQGRSAVAQTSWQDGFGMDLSKSKEVQIFDARTEGIAARYGFNSLDKLLFVPGVQDEDRPVFAIHRGTSLTSFSTSGQRITISDDIKSELIETDLQREGYEIVRAGLGRKRADGGIDWLHLSEPIRYAFPLANQSLIAVVSRKNKIFFVDRDNHELQLTLETLPDDQWAAYSPEGFFTGSINISDKLSWRRGTSITPMAELATRLERPDLLAEKLQSVGRGQAKNAAAVLQDEANQVFSAIQSMPYTLNRLGEFDQSSNSEAFNARFSLSGSEAAALPSISVKVNGREFVFEPTEYSYENNELVIPLTLESGTSFVEASTIWQGLTLNSVSMRVVTEIATDASGVDKSAPRLFFFGAGVSDYADDDLELEFAHKDVQTVADMMRTTEGDLFSEVRTHLLLDTEATQSKIQREMDDFISQASADDVILIFLSGHGMQEVDNSLYFVPHDAETDRTYTLVDLKLVRQQLMKRPPSQKALLWLDLCNAGAFGQENRSKSLQRLVVTVDDAVKLVSEGSGVSVLASSAGRQESYEGAEYGGGHGAFTAALIEGLNGRSDREAGNSDGLVFVQELQTFVMRRVPQMTKGKQHPTVPLVSNLRDFPISVATQ